MNDKIQKIRTKLLELGYIDNEWLNKYLELLRINISRSRDRKSTQEHHAIPVNSYWKSDEPYNRHLAEKLARQDVDNFKVNLLYKDHLLIHSYLTMCTNLDLVQQHYEEQASLRKANGQLGAIATNKTLNKNLSGKFKRADSAYVTQFYSANEVEEIMSL